MSTKPKHAKLLDNGAAQGASADTAQNTATGSTQGTAPSAAANTSQNAAVSNSPFSRTQAEGYHKRRKRVFRKQMVVRSLLGVLAAVFVAAVVGAGIWYASVQAQLNN